MSTVTGGAGRPTAMSRPSPLDNTAACAASSAARAGRRVAVLTDNPVAELRLVDVSSPASSEPAGSIDLPGGSAPAWGRWQSGELHLGRGDGTVELWRWTESGPELHASFAPDSGAARASMRFGDQLWIGLDDGRLFQVDLTRGIVVGELALGDPEPEPVIGMAREGSLLRVATTLHVHARARPDAADDRAGAGSLGPRRGAVEPVAVPELERRRSADCGRRRDSDVEPCAPAWASSVRTSTRRLA
jgi:hypothetical protein